VDARIQNYHLDVVEVAAGAGRWDQLEVSDLRRWLQSRRPWAALSLLPESARVEKLFRAPTQISPHPPEGERRDRQVTDLQDLARALAIAEAQLTADDPVRDEELAALDARISGLPTDREKVFSTLKEEKLGELVKEIEDWHRDHHGVLGALDEVGKSLGTFAFNLEHGGLFVASGKPEHEGHYKNGVWKNWTANYEVRPQRWVEPRSEAELSDIVQNAKNLRVVGGGHSFNDGPLCDDTLVSLDAMNRVLSIDLQARTARIQAGIRLRDLNKLLYSKGLGLPMLGPTDAQSVGGLVATDLHSIGRDHGFLSEQVLSLRVMDAAGQSRTVRRGDDLFHAVFGAIGTCGIVTELELQVVPAFRLEKITQVVDRKQTEAGISALIDGCDHLSFYYIAGGKKIEAMRQHRWLHTQAPPTENWEKKKVEVELSDFAISAMVPGLAKGLVALDEDSKLSNALAPDHSGKTQILLRRGGALHAESDPVLDRAGRRAPQRLDRAGHAVGPGARRGLLRGGADPERLRWPPTYGREDHHDCRRHAGDARRAFCEIPEGACHPGPQRALPKCLYAAHAGALTG
jgi:FAD binding domain